MRVLRRLRAGLPDRDADREDRHRDRPARAFGGHDLRLLRRRLHVQGRDARRGGRAHGALQGRQGQSRPFLRQGPLRLGLRHPQGPHPQADDPREDHRAVARSDAGTRRSTASRRSSSASRPSTAGGSIGGITSSRCTNEETYLVQKLVRAGFGNNNVDTCARVCHSPTGYGLKTDLRHLGRHAGFRLGRADRRHHGHRRQPDRRPSGVRLAHEEAAARRAPS